MDAPGPVTTASETIRIAIPMHTGAFCEHFGATRPFRFYEDKR